MPRGGSTPPFSKVLSAGSSSTTWHGDRTPVSPRRGRYAQSRAIGTKVNRVQMMKRHLRVHTLGGGSSVLALVLLEACASSGSSGGPTADARAAARAQRAAAEAAEATDQGPSEVLSRLRASVKTLIAPASAWRQQQIASALGSLGSSLKLLPNPDLRAPSILRDAARTLKDLPVESADRTDALKKGLTVAQRALLAREVTAEHSRAYFDAVARLSQALKALDTGRPLLEQQPTVAAAFQGATDAVFLAWGDTAPFATDAPPKVQTLGSIKTELAEATAAVLELGRARRPTQASAHALSSLADAVAAIDGGPEPGSHVSRMRVQAERLEHADSLSFRRAEWIKQGLSVALDALEATSRGDTRVAPFTQTARDAIDGINENSSIGFQRGVLQDAFRTTLQALLAAAQPAATCPPEPTAAFKK
jgi:hypothetical protein